MLQMGKIKYVSYCMLKKIIDVNIVKYIKIEYYQKNKVLW